MIKNKTGKAIARTAHDINNWNASENTQSYIAVGAQIPGNDLNLNNSNTMPVASIRKSFEVDGQYAGELFIQSNGITGSATGTYIDKEESDIGGFIKWNSS